MNERRNSQEKANIVVEYFTISIFVAVLCRKRNVSLITFQVWGGLARCTTNVTQ